MLGLKSKVGISFGYSQMFYEPNPQKKQRQITSETFKN